MNAPDPAAQYESRILPLYTAQSSPKPVVLDLNSLGMDQCPAWQEAAAMLPENRELWLPIANRALKEHRVGEALALYRRMLELFPDDAEIIQNTGVIMQVAGDPQGAIRHYEQALALNPDHGDAAIALAQLLSHQNPETALEILKRHQRSCPETFEVGLLQLIIQLCRQPATEPTSIAKAVQQLADGCDANQHAQLVRTLFQQGQVELGRDILEHAPPSVPTWQGLIHRFTLMSSFLPSDTASIDALRLQLIDEWRDVPEVNHCLSSYARSNHLYADSLAFAEAVLEQQPDNIRALSLAAENQLSLRQRTAAMALLERCLSIDGMQADIHRMLGYACFGNGEIEASRAWLHNSLRLRPRAGQHWQDMAVALYLHGEPDEALMAATRACECEPENHHARCTRGILHLLMGDYAAGWPDYEYRIHPQLASVCPPNGIDRWDGQTELDDLVLVSEQGGGDLIHFLRYVPFLRLSIPRVSVLVPGRLRSLMELSGVFTAVYCYGESIPIHGQGGWIPFLSVPALLGISTECVLIDEPYLQAPEQAVQHWSEILGRHKRPSDSLLVGLHWQGNPGAEFSMLAGRSFALERLAPLATIPGITFVSLQKGAGSEQLVSCSFRDRFTGIQPEVDACWDYPENAAVLTLCDLIITSDSAIAHLAGALGRPVWLLLPKTPEWRWGLTGDRSPWYPSMRLFRQEKAGDWRSVVEEVKTELAKFC